MYYFFNHPLQVSFFLFLWQEKFICNLIELIKFISSLMFIVTSLLFLIHISTSSGNYVVDFVVKNLLVTDPNKRFSATYSSNILCLLYCGCPEMWFCPGYNLTISELQM